MLGWPGAVVALAFGGWNARPFTVILYSFSEPSSLYRADLLSAEHARKTETAKPRKAWSNCVNQCGPKSMTYAAILLEKKNSIAYVTVNRPKVLNALNMATMEELRAAFHDIKNDASIRVVILTGAGEKAFIAGADIGELAKNDAVSGKEYTHRGQNVLNLIENLGKPVIACINGFALGGGCEIALACTMRLASENAKLGQPEVKLGIIPGYGGTQRLPRLVGKGIAMQMVLAGEMITAQEAHRIGLVNEVTVAAELIPRAEAIAAKIIANAPLAVQYAMEAVNKGMEMTLSEGLYLEAVLFGVACATEDKKEGTAAFLEKRAAVFKGK